MTRRENMKKWLLLFLPAFCLGVVIGCFFAEKTRKNRERALQICTEKQHKRQPEKSPLVLLSCGRESPFCPYFRVIRRENTLEILFSFCPDSRDREQFLNEMKQEYPELSRSGKQEFSRFFSRPEFFPGGIFSFLRPEERYRTDSLETGICRSGNRIYLLWEIPAGDPGSEGKSAAFETKAPVKTEAALEKTTGRDSLSRWLPLSILLVCIVVGFLLILILKRR